MKKIAFIILLVGFCTSCDLFNADEVEEDVSPTTSNYDYVDIAPAWSPDGNWIAYTRTKGPKEQRGIFLIRPDGTDNRFLHQGWAYDVTWSPDNNWIAFIQNGQVYKKHIQLDTLQQLTFPPGRSYYPSWSPDGGRIAYGKSNNDSTRSGLRYVTPSGNKDWFITEYGVFPKWLNENEILFRLDLHDKNGNFTSTSVKRVNIHHRNVLEVLNVKPHKLLHLISYNDLRKEILFTGYSKNAPSIFSQSLKGGKRTLLMEYSDEAAWSPDGLSIVYTNINTGNGYLWIKQGDQEPYQLTK